MDKNERLDRLDQAMYVSTVNFFTVFKEAECIAINGFDSSNDAHLALLEIAKIASYILHIPVKIELSLIKRFIFRKRLKCLKGVSIKYGKIKEETSIEADEFIKHIEDAYQDNTIFVQLYEEYYSK